MVAGSSRVDFPPVKEPRILYSGSLTHACVLTDSSVVDILNETMVNVKVYPQIGGRMLCIMKSEAE